MARNENTMSTGLARRSKLVITMKAAWLYDAGRPCGIEASTAKHLAAEAGFNACKQAATIHGGMGYAREVHVERPMREVVNPCLASAGRQMAVNFLAERALDLPKSY